MHFFIRSITGLGDYDNAMSVRMRSRNAFFCSRLVSTSRLRSTFSMRVAVYVLVYVCLYIDNNAYHAIPI